MKLKTRRAMNRLMNQLPRWPYVLILLLACMLGIMGGVLLKTHSERAALTASFNVR